MNLCSVCCSEELYESQAFPERELSALVASKVRVCRCGGQRSFSVARYERL